MDLAIHYNGCKSVLLNAKSSMYQPAHVYCSPGQATPCTLYILFYLWKIPCFRHHCEHSISLSIIYDNLAADISVYVYTYDWL